MLKKLAVAALALAISAPAFADRGRHGHDRNVVQKYRYETHRPVVRHHYHRPAPQRVVVVHRPQPVYYAPQPVYYHPHPNGAALVVGAVLGAAVAHHIVTGSY